jgi:membrane-associated PAP2 superfamily phosphatase
LGKIADLFMHNVVRYLHLAGDMALPFIAGWTHRSWRVGVAVGAFQIALLLGIALVVLLLFLSALRSGFH